ncbi:MAG: macro domain-containing protein [Clostridia bacterium]|nr:macro domain-containing protein [Clostridia bacterium]
MPFYFVCKNITTIKVDAIVNAANAYLTMGGGVCGAIFEAAGADELSAACHKIAPVETGMAAITSGFNLPSKYIIHAVGPMYSYQDAENCRRLLRSAYIESLRLAHENSCESVAFPLISGGIYGYPKGEALEVAVTAINEFLQSCDMDVYLTFLDKSSFEADKPLIAGVKEYLNQLLDQEPNLQMSYCPYSQGKLLKRHSVENIKIRAKPSALKELSSTDEVFSDRSESVENKVIFDAYTSKSQLDSMPHSRSMSLAETIESMDEPFAVTLIWLIDQKGAKETNVYKKANIDRKLFSKIKTQKDYTPSKRTVLALAIALKLNLSETQALLTQAGYALSHAKQFDVIVEYFIINKKYDIFEINEALFEYDQPLLGY